MKLSAPKQNDPTFVVDAQLRSYASAATLLNAPGTLKAFQAANGEVHLMSLAADGGLLVVRPAADLPGTYRSHHIGTPSPIQHFCVALTSDGHESMEALAENGDVLFLRNRPWGAGWQFNTTLAASGVSPGGTSSWRFCDGVGGLMCATVPNAGGILQPMVLHSKGSYRFEGPGPYTLSRFGPLVAAGRESWALGTLNGRDGFFLSAVNTLSTYPGNQGIYFEPLDEEANYQQLLLHVLPTMMSAVQTRSGTSYVFYQDSADNNLYFLDSSAPNGPSAVRIPWQTSPASSVLQVQASVSSAQQPEVFCRDQAGRLWHASFQQETQSFTELLPLADGILHFSAAKNSLGTTELFAVTRSGNIQRFLEAGVSTASGWRMENCTVASPETPQDSLLKPYYSMQFTVLDSVTSVPRADEAVTLHAQEDILVEANGLSYEIGPNAPAHLLTDTRGQILVRYRASKLATPRLKLSHSFFAPGRGIVIDCAAQAKVKLLALSPADLASATTPKFTSVPQTSLLNASWQPYATAVKQLSAALLGAQSPLTTEPTPVFLNRGSARLGIAAVTAGWGFDAAHLPGAGSGAPPQNWSMTFVGTPSFQVHSPQEAGVKIRAAAALEAQSFWSTLSDLWTSIEAGVAKVVEIVCSAGTLAITFLLNGATMALVAAYNSAAEALSTLESVLGQIGAKLDQWLGWLADLGNWTDIGKTKVQVEALYTDNKPRLYSYIQQMEGSTHTFFGKLETDVTAWFQTLKQTSKTGFPFVTLGSMQQLAMQPMPRRSTAGGPPEVDRQTIASTVAFDLSNNWLYQQTTDILESIWSNPFGSDPLTGLIDAMNELFKSPKIQQIVEQLEKIGQEAAQLLMKLVSDFGELQNIVLADLLLIFEDLIKTALTVMDVLVQACLGLLRDLVNGLDTILTKKLDLPFLSAFYTEVVCPMSPGEDLTLLRLLSLLIAAPLTVMYKAANGQSPCAAEPAEAKGDDAPPAELLLWIRSIAMALFGSFDVDSDIAAIESWAAGGSTSMPEVSSFTPAKYFNVIASCALPLMVQWCTTPNEATPQTSFMLWCAKWAAPAFSGLFIPFGSARGSLFGLPVLVGIGGALLGLGIADCIARGKGTENFAADTLSLMPGVWLSGKLLLPLTDPSEGLSDAVVLALDTLNAGIGAALPFLL